MGCLGSKPLGRQLYDAARNGNGNCHCDGNGNAKDVAELLKNPKARSFINWQDEVACVAYPSPCSCTVFL